MGAGGVEVEVEETDDGLRMTVALESAFERLLLHGVAEYHNLRSVSAYPAGAAVSPERRTTVRSTAGSPFVRPERRLSDVLRRGTLAR